MHQYRPLAAFKPTPRARPWCRVALALACLATSAIARAAAVYQQVPLALPDIGVVWTSQTAAAGGYRSFDDFTLSQPATLGRATWRGAFFNQDGSNGLPLTTSWTLAFWSGALGPVSELFSVTASAADVAASVTSAGAVIDGNKVDVYDFDLDFGPTGLAVAADTRYWFTVLADAAAFRPNFAWSQATGGGSSAQWQLDGSGAVVADFGQRFGNRAFALYAVPAPGSLALVALGLVLAAAASGRRR